MKKLAIFLGLTFIIALASCNKEKECECVTTYSGDGSEYTSDINYELTIKKGDCSDHNQSITTFEITATTTCTQK